MVVRLARHMPPPAAPRPTRQPSVTVKSLSTRRATQRHSSIGMRTFAIGASADSCGGVTAFRCGAQKLRRTMLLIVPPLMLRAASLLVATVHGAPWDALKRFVDARMVSMSASCAWQNTPIPWRFLHSQRLASAKMRTCLTPGSVPHCGRFQRWVGQSPRALTCRAS